MSIGASENNKDIHLRRRFSRRPPPRPRGPRINNQIRISPVRVIDETGKNLGELPVEEAVRIAAGRGLDLIEVGPNARPPVCRIADYGKWKYEQAKRARTERQSRKTVQSEVKGVRITFRASPHDLQLRAHQADEFLLEGHTVRVEMILRGREKGKEWFAKERMREFLTMLKASWKTQQDLRPGGRGIEMLIVRDKTKAAPKETFSDQAVEADEIATL